MRQQVTLLLLFLLSVLVLLEAVTAVSEDRSRTDTVTDGRTLHPKDGNFSQQQHHQHHQEDLEEGVDPSAGPTFTLKVQVSDALNGHFLDQAVVEVFVNYTKTNRAVAREDGVVLLRVPYRAGLPVAIVASRDRFIPTMLPWKTSRVPIFSSVSLSLLGSNQGNIWLFEDSVLITGKTSDASSHPSARFPKKLLHLTESSDVTSLQAFLTIPKLSAAENAFLNTVGVMNRQSDYTSVELRPVAAASIQLFSRDSEVHVNGSILITLPVLDNYKPRASNAVPAWFFNKTTGGWMRKGLGTVKQLEGKPVWSFTAPHLGYWIAAPLSSTNGFVGLATPRDLMSQHWPFLMAVLGGTLVIIVGLLLAVLCHHRGSLSETKTKRVHADRTPALKKDQTTSTYDNELFEVTSGVSCHQEDEVSQTFTEQDNRHNDSILSKHSGNETVGPSDPNANFDDPTHVTVPLSLADSVFFYKQPVTILHAPAFFHLEEQTELWSKSATLPRASAAPVEPPSTDNFTQTLGKCPSMSQNETRDDTEGHAAGPEGSTPQAPSVANLSRSHFSLPESVSEPGATTKTSGDNRHSCSGAFPGELQGSAPSPLPSRAWFVSLEGKPAAEIHRSVSEQQRRQRPAESRDTSLDSGVDMSELNQTAGKRTVTLERKATFIKSTPSSRPASDQ